MADPHCLKNLIDDPKLANTRKELSAKLDAWMKSQGDKGAATEEIAHTRTANFQKRKKGGAKKPKGERKNKAKDAKSS
jgi:hypothetical protein